MIYAVLDNQYKVDGFNPKEVVTLLRSEAKLTNIVDRGGTLSNIIKVSKTSNNQRTFGLLDNLQALTPQAYKLFTCDLYVEELKVFTGSLQVIESNQFFSLRVFSSSAGFFNLLKERKINTIDLSSFNHTWTAANVNSRRANTTGVVYPNINYGRWTDVANTAKAHTDWFPAVYLNTLIERIAVELGYSYTPLSNFKAALPFSKDYFTNNISIEAGLLLGSDDTYLVAASPIGIDFDTLVADPLSYFVSNNGTGWELPAGNVKVSGVINYSAEPGNGAPVTIGLYQNNGGLLLNEIVSVPAGGSGTINYEFSASNSLGFGNLIIAIDGTNNGDEIVIESGSTFNIDEGELTILDGNVIAIQDTLPNLGITDLFKYIAVKTNSLILVDNEQKTVRFELLNDIAGRINQAIDLSEKVADFDSINTYFRFEEYGQENNLDYKVPDLETDPTALPFITGRGTFTINDSSLISSKLQYEAPFFVSGKFIGIKQKPTMVLIPRYSSTALDYDEPDQVPGIRVLQINIDTSILIDISGQSSVSPQANAEFISFASDVTTFYSSLQAALNPCKIIEVPINLTDQDFADIDFTKPLFLLGAYWFLLEMRGYEVNTSSPTIFKLLKLY